MTISLNDDVLLEVIEYIYYNPQGNPDKHALHSFSLVCKQWASCAASYLWRAVDTEPLDNEQLLSFSHSLESRYLAAQIFMLDLVLEPGRPFASIYAACPQIYQLRVTIKQQELVDPLPEMLNVRSLVLNTWPTMSRIPFAILQRTPALRCLRLHGELASWPPKEPPRFKLYELSLRRPPRDIGLSWLLTAAQGSLRILESLDVPGPAMRNFIATYGPHLRSLRVLIHSFAWRTPLRACCALEEYQMVRLPSLQPLTELPSTIQHISFGNMGQEALGPITRLVSSSMLPNLRIVTYNALSEEQDDFAALKTACARANVELCREEFPFWNSEDAVETERFPRRKVLSNIKYMR